MISAQQHYEQHLGPIYTWMVGGVESAFERGAAELDAVGVRPSDGGIAIDLGAGFGMHAIPLARQGFKVLAIDSSAILLHQLQAQAGILPIQAVQDDLRSFGVHLSGKADLVLCMGDTLPHLAEQESVTQLLASVSAKLNIGGRFIATLRDYSRPLVDEQRFIPVRSDESRILTCVLEYTDSHVAVHDIVHERNGAHWDMSVSKYQKLRLSPEWLTSTLRECGFEANQEAGFSGMIRFVARRV